MRRLLLGAAVVAAAGLYGLGWLLNVMDEMDEQISRDLA